MKNTLLLFSGLMLFLCCGTSSAQNNAPAKNSGREVVIRSSPAMNDIALGWAAEYNRLNPPAGLRVTLETEGVRSIEVTEVPSVSGWKMIIGHNAIVAVINAENPLLEKINLRGIAPKDFSTLLSSEKPDWNSVLQVSGIVAPVSINLSADPYVKESLAKFSGISATSITGRIAGDAEELISAVRSNRYATGFCRFSDIMQGKDELPSGLTLLPVDKNSNRRIDYFENIYENPAEFMRGVLIGKYPREISGSIYLTADRQPSDEATIAFITWLMTNAGPVLSQNGISPLAETEIKAALATLQPGTASAGKQERTASVPFPAVLVILLAAALGYVIFKIVRSRNSAPYEGDLNIAPALDEYSIKSPVGLFYDKTHTWAFMERDGLVRMGIDDFIPHLTGELTRIKTKETGEKIIKGEKILSIVHEGKQLEIHSPVSGTIKSINTDLDIDPSLINSSPFYDGWIYLIQPMNWLRETEFLLMGDHYREWLRTEFSRLKDFFANVMRKNSVVYEQVILQDGGQITDNVLAGLSPEVWEDFQRNFIDSAR
jgi:glycine cleavage system H lipoate-binding protein